MTDADIALEPGPAWLTVRLDRPAVRNALRRGTWHQLDAALDRAETDGEVAGVTLTGGPAWFSSGADLTDIGSPEEGGPWASVSRLHGAQRVLRRLRGFGKPTIAAVEGYAIGVGWSLALACDLLVASRTAFFAPPAGAAGMIADGGLVRDLCEAIGHRRAAELLLTRTRLEAADAMRHGLVTELTEPGRSEQHAVELAARIAALPASVRFATKSMLAAAQEVGGAGFLEHEALAVAYNRQQPERAQAYERFAAGERFYFARGEAGPRVRPEQA
jgi:2-(1,2-epoxy-1,2-dihydrophenyl)acetyl-CoA isomerase